MTMTRQQMKADQTCRVCKIGLMMDPGEDELVCSSCGAVTPKGNGVDQVMYDSEDQAIRREWGKSLGSGIQSQELARLGLSSLKRYPLLPADPALKCKIACEDVIYRLRERLGVPHQVGNESVDLAIKLLKGMKRDEDGRKPTVSQVAAFAFFVTCKAFGCPVSPKELFTEMQLRGFRMNGNALNYLGFRFPISMVVPRSIYIRKLVSYLLSDGDIPMEKGGAILQAALSYELDAKGRNPRTAAAAIVYHCCLGSGVGGITFPRIARILGLDEFSPRSFYTKDIRESTIPKKSKEVLPS